MQKLDYLSLKVLRQYWIDQGFPDVPHPDCKPGEKVILVNKCKNTQQELELKRDCFKNHFNSNCLYPQKIEEKQLIGYIDPDKKQTAPIKQDDLDYVKLYAAHSHFSVFWFIVFILATLSIYEFIK
jgi:hypothetical protein